MGPTERPRRCDLHPQAAARARHQLHRHCGLLRPEDSENLIHEALHPFNGIHVATKGGFTRHGPNIWAAVGRPEYLRQCCLMSLRRLRVETIELWQLHRIDPKVPRERSSGS